MVAPYRLVFEPFGVWRGIFHQVVVSKYAITVIYPTTGTFILVPGRSGRGLVIEQPLAGSDTPEQVQFFPKGSVAPILRALAEQHYQLDPKPGKAKIIG